MVFVRRALVLAALALAFCALTASPAAAHGVANVPATNLEVRVLSLTPRIGGLEVRAVDLGAHLELHNDSGVEVTVLGYDGEPYLRIGPDGVFRNARSPATFWNEQSFQSGSLPSGFDAAARPEWEPYGTGPVVRWHDHRAHWMGGPRAPGSGRVTTWELTLLADGEPVVVQGDIVALAAPSPLPALLTASGAAALVVLGVRTRAWAWVLAAALLLLCGLAFVDVAGRWDATTRSATTKLLEGIYALAGAGLGAWAAVRLALGARRGDPYESTPMALLAAVVLTVSLALGEVGWITKAILPTTVPASLARPLAGLALGTGIGCVAGAAMRLRRPTLTDRSGAAAPAHST
jgi:hypothetical protein